VFLYWQNSAADWTRELFKPLKDSASLQICNEKNLLVLAYGFLVDDVTNGVVLGVFGPLHLGSNC